MSNECERCNGKGYVLTPPMFLTSDFGREACSTCRGLGTAVTFHRSREANEL